MKERKKVLNLYGLFGATLVLSVLPHVGAAVLSLIFVTVLMVMAYSRRSKSELHSLAHNHTTFIIRSLWICAFMMFFTVIAAAVYIFMFLDALPFAPCAEAILNQMDAMGDQIDIMALSAASAPCMDRFMAANYNVLLSSAIIGIAPPLAYISYRFIKGLRRAVRGYRLADPNVWF